MSCRDIDSFVHRSGRTARRGKEGLSILFFEQSQMKFILDIEKKLNINIQFASQIDDALHDEDGDSPVISALKDHVFNRKKRNQMRVDRIDSEQIYEILVSDETSDSDREQYIQYLIDFYIEKNHYKLDTIGFVSGR